jgi:hypothetical protein
MADPDVGKNWAKLDPKKAAAAVQKMVDANERNLGWRHQMALRGAMAYSGCGRGDLFEGLMPFDAPFGGDNRKRPKRNGGWNSKGAEQHARATAETLAEKITGLDEPKTQMVATDAEWELRRQGIWADRFIEGNMHLPQGMFLDTWDVARHGFLLSAVSTGTVAARVEPDYVGKRVRTQLRSTLQTFIDPGDVANGMPLSYFDVTWENPEYMCEDERFKKHEDVIMKSAKVPPFQLEGSYDGASFGTKMVKIVSAWRMPFGSFKGRAAMFVGGDSILWEGWEFPQPPLAFFRMNRALNPANFWGENFIEIMLDPLSDADEIDALAKRTMDRTSQTYISMGTNTQLPSALKNALDVNVFRYDTNKNERDITVHKPDILAQQYFDWRDRKIQVAKELSGVPDLHIASQASAGQSGRAIRLEASLLPERFAKKMRNWRHWVAVDIATMQIRAAREIGKVEPNWQVTWPGADFDSKVSVEVLDIDDSIYEIRPYAVSENKNTPADRAAMADEMLASKQITPQQHSVIMNGLLDTPKESKVDSVQQRYVAKVLDQMLHAKEDVIADENRYMAEDYMPPPPWFDPGAMMAQALPIYGNAMIDGVPQNRRALMRRFLEDITALDMQQKREEAMSQAQVSVAATPEQAFPGAPTPGMPPGGPNGQADLGIAPPAPPPMAGAEGVPPQNVGGMPGLA